MSRYVIKAIDEDFSIDKVRDDYQVIWHVYYRGELIEIITFKRRSDRMHTENLGKGRMSDDFKESVLKMCRDSLIEQILLE